MVESLFRTGRIGELEVENRIVMPPMGTFFGSEDGRVTDQTRNYYRERAKGGTGLLIFEGSYPCERHPNRHLLVDDSYIDGLSSVVDAVHEEGSKLAIQLSVHRASADEHRPLAPSQLTTPRGKEVPAITTDEIDEFVETYAQGAVRAKEAGFDGIEIHGASGYLIQQFFSPRTNERDDEYGGSLSNRTRFARELIAAVREAVGVDYPVWYRISADEFIDGGYGVDEAERIAVQLADAGSDAIHATGGHFWNSMHVPSGAEKRGLYADYAERIRSSVDVPVITVGRVNDPVLAAELLEEGKADFVAMGRAHIADPHFVRKARNGELERIRFCVGGMEGCREMKHAGFQPLACTVNPNVGREGDRHVETTADPKDVTVVGGGPAGMEAARVASMIGHDVTLFEKKDRLGGQLAWAANAPAKQEYGPLLSYYETELGENGVVVHLEEEFGEHELRSTSADEIIVATGAATSIPTVQGLSEAAANGRVIEPETVLLDDELDYDHAIVLGATERGCDTAECLSSHGVRSTVLLENGHSNHPNVILPTRYERTSSGDDPGTARGNRVQRMRDDPLIDFLDGKLRRIDRDRVAVTQDDETETIEYDVVVLAQKPTENTPAFDLSERDRSVHVIGDARQVRHLYSAIHEGADVARSLDDST